MNRIQIASFLGALALCCIGGEAAARDPNKVRCRAVSTHGAQLDARYEAERRQFSADFSVGTPSPDYADRWEDANRASGTRMQRFAPGDVLPVRVAGELVGNIVLDAGLRGRLSFDEDARGRRGDGDQAFPANFPPFPPGTVTQVGELSCVGQRR